VQKREKQTGEPSQQWLGFRVSGDFAQPPLVEDCFDEGDDDALLMWRQLSDQLSALAFGARPRANEKVIFRSPPWTLSPPGCCHILLYLSSRQRSATASSNTRCT
jgi:hypothetical protein